MPTTEANSTLSRPDENADLRLVIPPRAVEPAFVVCDSRLRVLSWSESARSALGFDAASCMGRNALELFAPDEVDEVASLLRSAQAGETVAARVVASAGSAPRVALQLRAVPLVGPSGVQAIVLTFSETGLTDEGAGASSPQRLAPVVAHELNNVLTVIRTYTHFARQAGSRDQRSRDLRVIAAAAERGAALTDWLASTAEHAPRVRADLSGGQFLLDVTLRLRQLVHDGTTIEVGPSPEDVTFQANALRLEHVLMAVVLVANRALAGGSFRLSMERRAAAGSQCQGPAADEVAALLVHCSASAASEAARSQLTSAVDQVTELKAPLSALLGTMNAGLVIARTGDQQAEFEILLPKALRSPEPRAKVQVPLVAHPQKILVVEDDPSIRLGIVRTLAGAGYPVLEAADGIVARELLSQYGYAVGLLVSDIMLPRGGGPDLFAWARASCPNAGLLLISGREREGSAAASSLGAGFLAKPFYPAELLTSVRRAIADVQGRVQQTPVSAARRLVLVVDDDADIRESFQRLLGECDFETLVAGGGAEALEILGRRHVDAVVSDQYMPGLDGIALLELVCRRFSGCARILCTSHPASDAVIGAVRRGQVQRVLAKTMHAVALRDEIERAVRELTAQPSIES